MFKHCLTVFILVLCHSIISEQMYQTADLTGQSVSHSARRSLPATYSKVLSPGDSVGVTDYDFQLNGGCRRYIHKTQAGGYHFYWTFRYEDNHDTRRATYRYFQPPSTWSPVKIIDDRMGRMGSLSQLKDGRAVATAHVTPDSTGFNYSFVYIDSTVGEGKFKVIRLPIAEGADTSDQPIWPNVAVDSNNTIYVTGTQQFAKIGWWTCSKDLGETWSPWSDTMAGYYLDATSWNSAGHEILVTRNNKVAIVTSTDGATDLFLYQTENQGEAWSRSVIFAVAEPDSVKPYSWYSGLFDNSDVLHVTYTVIDTTPGGGGGGQSGSGWRSQVRYWNSATRANSIVTSGWWALRPGPGSNHPTVAESNIAIDRTNGHLYCTWTQANNNDDVSEYLFNNLELYGAKSTDNGATWIYPQNMTKSQAPNSVPGEGQSDWWHSIAENVSDDVIDIFYMNDRDPGTVLFDGTTVTNNPMRFLKHKIVPVSVKKSLQNPHNRMRFTLYPNPFRQKIEIRLADRGVVSKSDKQKVALEIYNTNGRLVKEASFKSKYIWNGTDNSGSLLSAGIYFLTLTIDEMKYSSRLTLVK